MKQPKRYLITAALPYANGQKHIGHLAGAYLPADIYVRYLKAQKREVVFVCGSDEHGTAIPIQATKEGTTARAIIDKYHPLMEQNFKDLGIAFDVYHRTSDPCTMKQHRNFLHGLTTMATWKSRKQNNILTSVPIPFWPTDTSKVPAPTAAMKAHMATNANAAVRV